MLITMIASPFGIIDALYFSHNVVQTVCLTAIALNPYTIYGYLQRFLCGRIGTICC